MYGIACNHLSLSYEFLSTDSQIQIPCRAGSSGSRTYQSGRNKLHRPQFLIVRRIGEESISRPPVAPFGQIDSTKVQTSSVNIRRTGDCNIPSVISRVQAFSIKKTGGCNTVVALPLFTSSPSHGSAMGAPL